MQDGMGLGNWTFALNDSDTPLAGKPMCSGSLFEFCKRQDDQYGHSRLCTLAFSLSQRHCLRTDNGDVMDVLGIYRMAQWSERSGQRYMAVIRGFVGAYERNLAGFLVAAGTDHYFLQFSHCASANLALCVCNS